MGHPGRGVVLCLAALVAWTAVAVAQEGSGSSEEELLEQSLEGVSLGTTLMLGFVHKTNPDRSSFRAKRAYINIRFKASNRWSARLTPDVYEDDDGTEYRLKYGYASFKAGGWHALTDLEVEVGLVHTVWLDFEEHINGYRLQDSMFLDRVGLLTSADFGVTVSGHFGGSIEAPSLNNFAPGRYGSFAIGIYNGSGYSAVEENSEKVFQSRLTLRPVPKLLPGVQISHLAVIGQGNRTDPFDPDGSTGPLSPVGELPDWRVHALMLSAEHRWFTFTALGETGVGDLDGSLIHRSAATEHYRPGEALVHRGGSAFLAFNLLPTRFSLLGRLDVFDPDIHVGDDRQDRWIAGVAVRPDKPMLLLVDMQWLDYQDPTMEDSRRFQVTLQIKS